MSIVIPVNPSLPSSQASERSRQIDAFPISLLLSETKLETGLLPLHISTLQVRARSEVYSGLVINLIVNDSRMRKADVPTSKICLLLLLNLLQIYYRFASATIYDTRRLLKIGRAAMKFATEKGHGAMMYDVSRSQKCNFYPFPIISKYQY